MVGMGDVKVAEQNDKSIGFFDKAKFGKYLRENALPPYGSGKCATYVRKALEHSGLPTAGHPVSAKDYGPLLKKLKFDVVSQSDYMARPGDIVVFQGNSRSFHGHIQGHDGSNWISDFVQEKFYPGSSYSNEKTSYAIYRR